jgi:glutamate synthase (NADPH/NADH) small chain
VALTTSRTLPTKGIESKGVVQAMTFLTQQTKFMEKRFLIKYWRLERMLLLLVEIQVLTVGTSNRQGAKSVTNFEIMPKPPVGRSETTPWPYWPLQLKHLSSEEGCDRNWLIILKNSFLMKRRISRIKNRRSYLENDRRTKT